MSEMAQRLAETHGAAGRYQRAHGQYLADRARYGDVPEIAGTSAGGMPTGSSACTRWPHTRWPPGRA